MNEPVYWCMECLGEGKHIRMKLEKTSKFKKLVVETYVCPRVTTHKPKLVNYRNGRVMR